MAWQQLDDQPAQPESMNTPDGFRRGHCSGSLQRCMRTADSLSTVLLASCKVRLAW
jgi:hypothetical protein